MSSISISTEKVSGLENDWRQLFDLQLKGVEGNDEGIATKIFDAFLSCSILSAGAESCRVTMRNVIRRIQSLYLPNAYHSFFHAAHVVLSSNQMHKTLKEPYAPLDHFCLLYSGLVHDIQHEGVFNSTLVTEGHEAALTYNDVSVAEMKSISIGLQILRENLAGLGLTSEDYTYLRKQIIEMVLNTDLADPWRGKCFKLKVAEVLRETSVDIHHPQGKLVTLTLILKVSDISSLLQSFETVLEWAKKFFIEQSIAHTIQRGPPVTLEAFDRNQLAFFNGYCLDLIGLLESTKLSCIAASLRANVLKSVEEWKLRGVANVLEWEQAFKLSSSSGHTAKRHRVSA